MSDAMTTTHAPAPQAPGQNPSVEVAGNGAGGKHTPPLENLEEILMALAAFERETVKASSLLDVTIPPQLEAYLKAVAEDGTAQFPWSKIKPLFRVKLEQVIVEFNNRQVYGLCSRGISYI